MTTETKTINKSNWSGESSEIVIDKENKTLTIADYGTFRFDVKPFEDNDINSDDRHITVYDTEDDEYPCMSGYFFAKENAYYMKSEIVELSRESRCMYTAAAQIIFSTY
jgi:hypothetical protein